VLGNLSAVSYISLAGFLSSTTHVQPAFLRYLNLIVHISRSVYLCVCGHKMAEELR